MDEDRDCESGLAHQPHEWASGYKHYQCHGRTEPLQGTLRREPYEVIDLALRDAQQHEANGIEVTLWIIDALDKAGFSIVRKWS